MSLRRRLGNFCLFMGLIALFIFAADVSTPDRIDQYPMLAAGLVLFGLGIWLRVGKETPPQAVPPPPKPAAPKAASPAPKRPGPLTGLFKPKPKPAPGKPAGGPPKPGGKAGGPPPKKK